MQFFSPTNLLLLLGTLTVAEALTIPSNNLGDVNAKPSLDHATRPSVIGDGRFAKGRPIASALPVRQKPHTPSTSPPEKSPLPDKTKQSIKPLPYKPKPRPTKGYDVCDYEGLTCLSETSSGDAPAVPRLAVDSVSKRSSVRDPAKIDFGPEILTLTSKPYWTSGELFDDKRNGGLNLKEAWIDFAKDSMSDYKVQFFNKKPPQLSSSDLKHRYITEHIVELQSIPRFIEALTQTKSPKNPSPIKLRAGTVHYTWFTEWWNKDIQAKIDSRPTKFVGYKNANLASSKDKTLNSIVFEAMGSVRNVDDFLLCEYGINNLKASLWSNSAPISEDNWKNTAKFAASGQIPSNEHISGMRTVLAVYEYMNQPEVTKRMQKTIRNVKIELGNVKHLTNNKLPKNSQGVEVDLSTAWIDFMDQQLERFRVRGEEWLKDAVTFGLAEYKKALVILEKEQKTITAEKNEKDPKKKKAQEEKRTKARNKAVQSVTAKSDNLDKTEKVFNDAKEDLQAAETILEKIADRAKKEAEKKVQRWEEKRAEFRSARTKLTSAKKQYGKAERELCKHDDTLLRLEIENLTKDIGYLEAFGKAGRALKMPKAE